MADDSEDFGVKSRSFEQCEQAASQLRIGLGCVGDERIPDISSALSQLDLDVIVRTEMQMGEASAFARPDEREIHIREDMFGDYLDDKPNARFTALHELAHVSVHKGQFGQSRFFKMTNGNILLPFLSDDEGMEEQADRIARAALMPKAMVATHATPLNLAKAAGAPIAEAIKRIRELNVRKAGHLTNDIKSGIAQLAASASGINRNKKSVLSIDQRAKLAWTIAATAGKESPDEYRAIDGKWVIRWSRFQQSVPGGWRLEADNIIAWEDERSY